MNKHLKSRLLSPILVLALLVTTVIPVSAATRPIESNTMTAQEKQTGKTQDKDNRETQTSNKVTDKGNSQTATTAKASSSSQELSDEQLQATYILNQLGIVSGDGTSFDETESMTRAQMVVMIIRMLGLEDEALAQNYNKVTYSDVPKSYWAYDYIEYASQLGLVSGLGDGSFGVNDTVSEQQLLTFLLRALDYSDTDGDFTYSDVEDFATSLGWDIDIQDSSQVMRGEAFYMIYQALQTNAKDSNVSKGTELNYFDTQGDIIAEDGSYLTRTEIENGAKKIKNKEN